MKRDALETKDRNVLGKSLVYKCLRSGKFFIKEERT